MAHAYAVGAVRQVTGSAGRVNMVLQLVISGEHVQDGAIDTEFVHEFDGSTTVAQLRAAMSEGIAAMALERYGLTVSGTDMLLPTFQKG